MRLSERPELLRQIVSDSDVDCFEGCPHIVGHHEQQISEGGEVDLHEYVKDCKNNAAHTQFIPVKSLRLKHLLKGYHDKDVYNLIKAAAFLTVRISVTMISPHRPNVWPNTEVPYFLFNMIGSQHLRMASGIVKDIIPDDDKSCPCDKCQHSNTPSQKWWRIGVRTAANVVFDDIEAGHSVIRLFYDTEDSPEFLVRSLEEEALVEKNISEDWCTLDYITCDAKLVKRLDRMVDRYNELSGKVTEKYKNCQNQEKLMFLVSHPHGLCKQISIGQWETNSLGIYLKFTYSTYSCPGSAGAIAYFVGKGLRNHSGNMKSGLSYCSG
uniref:Uncharacterized protein n=1 Tax=Biomphalaria glabrata TaxID=6526 RepID=A0A2C9LLK0_BIOGL